MTTTIVTRAGKGSPLTWTEGDANFTNLQATADAALPMAGGSMSGKINFSIGSTQFQYNSVDVGGFYAPQTYSKYLGIGVTTDRTWSNTLQTICGIALGPKGETSLYNNTSASTMLAHGLYVGSDYALKYTTTGGVTPAYVKLTAGQVTFGVCTSSGTAGNSATMLEPLMIDAAGGSAGSVSLLSGQLKFPATQIASTDPNTLDDYEEGTFTPSDGSGAGLVFSTAVGRYVKIGKMVFVSIDVTYPATASGANASIAGLPFTSVNGDPRWALTPGYIGGASAGNFYFLVGKSTNTVTIYLEGTFAGNANMSTRDVFISGCYEAAS